MPKGLIRTVIGIAIIIGCVAQYNAPKSYTKSTNVLNGRYKAHYATNTNILATTAPIRIKSLADASGKTLPCNAVDNTGAKEAADYAAAMLEKYGGIVVDIANAQVAREKQQQNDNQQNTSNGCKA